MTAVEDFLSQAGAAPAQAPQTMAQKFALQAAASQNQPAAKTGDQGGFLDELKHQIGLTGRAIATGVTSLPTMLGDALNTGLNAGISGINSVTGSSIPKFGMPSQVVQQAEDKVFPQPRNEAERLVQAASSAGFGLAPTYAAGQQIAKLASPAAQALGRTLTSVPGNQIAAAASGGASAQGAKDAGLGPGWQLAAGLAGGVGGSLAAAAGGSAASRLSRALVKPEARPDLAAPAVSAVMEESPLPASPERTAALQTKAQSLMANAPGADAAAAARAADFQSLGMSGTLGQITRDPALYAQELNWRGVPGGEPLLSKFHTQNAQLADALENAAGSGAEPYADGKAIISSLSALDEQMRKQVSAAYKQASESAGAKINIPLQGVAQDYADVLHNFGDKVPSGVRNNFEALGLQSGTQKKVFGFEDAERLLQNINANRSYDPATNTALGKLSNAVKAAILGADDQGGVFAAPRQMAAERFALRERVPALADAADGIVAPEDFTRKYLMNGDVEHVSALADLLRQKDPQALAMAQGQVGNQIKQSAFGMNIGGDKSFSPERFAKALQNFGGSEKLNALFGPEATDDLYTIGRVGSYIHSEPAFSPVNRSNTAGALMDMTEHIPIVGKAISAAGKRAMIAKALQGNLKDTGGIVATPVIAPQNAVLVNAFRPVEAKQGQ